MRVLLDEHLDVHLKGLFDPAFSVLTVRERRWSGMKNGALLLNPYRVVEQVYAAAPAEGAQASSNNVTSRQGYLDPAPQGLDGRYAWTKTGGRGAGVRVVDVEYDWVTDHEDFPPSSQMFWGGRPLCPYVYSGSEHGTAVLGVIAARNNPIGVTGFASDVRYGLSSVCRPQDYAWGAIVATFAHQLGDHWVGRTHNVAVANAFNDGAAGGAGVQRSQRHPDPTTLLLSSGQSAVHAAQDPVRDGSPCPTGCRRHRRHPVGSGVEPRPHAGGTLRPGRPPAVSLPLPTLSHRSRRCLATSRPSLSPSSSCRRRSPPKSRSTGR